MLTKAEEAVLQHWRTVRERALATHAAIDTHAPGTEHDMPGLVAECDKAIAALETKAAEA